MLKMVDGTGIIGVDMVCPLGGTVSPPQPPNYDKVEMEGTGILVLPNSLNAPLERLELSGNSEQNQYVLVKEDGTTSVFNFGVKWNEVNKIVLVADSIAKTQHIFFATFTHELIGIYPDMRIRFNGLTNGQCNLTYAKITDGNKHEIIFTFDRPTSDREITNIWDASWSKKIRYYRIGFYSDDTLVANFIPDSENKMFDTVSKTYISASIKYGVYKLEQAEGDPAPDNPQEIKSAGKYDEVSGKYLLDVKVTGKNLFDREKARDITNWIIKDNDGYAKFPIYVKQGNKITFSYTEKLTTGKKFYLGISLSDAGSTVAWLYHDTTASITNNKYTIAATNDYIYLMCSKSDIQNFVDTIQTLQVEISPTQTNYEPYKEQLITLSSDRPITKWDKLVEQGGQIGWLYKSKTATITGKEHYSAPSESYYSGTSTNMYTVDFGLFIKGGEYCNRLQRIDGIWDSSNTNNIGFTTNASDQIHIRIYNSLLNVSDNATKEEKVAAFKTYLTKEYENGNPYIVIFQTKDTEFIPLPQSEQNAIRALKTYYPTTVITVDGGELDPDIKVTYRKEI